MQEESVHIDRVTSSAGTLVRRVIRILRGCGISESELREILSKEISGLEHVAQPRLASATARELIICSDVVLRWRRDSRFLTSDGLPALLSVDRASPSFAELTHAVTPASDPVNLLEKMKELGVVSMAGVNKIELISESIVACAGRDDSLTAPELVLEHVGGFLGSVEYNLFEKPSRTKGRFERACYGSVPEKLVPVLQNLVSSKGQDFVDVIDEWLARRAGQSTDECQTVLVGAGVYVFVRPNV